MLKKSDKSPFENAETNSLFGWFAETVKLQIRWFAVTAFSLKPILCWFAETVGLAKLLKCLKKGSHLGSNLVAALAGLQVDNFPHIADSG